MTVYEIPCPHGSFLDGIVLVPPHLAEWIRQVSSLAFGRMHGGVTLGFRAFI